MKTPLGKSESESRGRLLGRDCETPLSAWEDLHGGTGAFRGWEYCCGGARAGRRASFALQPIKQKFQLLPCPVCLPLLSWLPRQHGYGKKLPVALIPGPQEQGDVKTAILGHAKFELPETSR